MSLLYWEKAERRRERKNRIEITYGEIEWIEDRISSLKPKLRNRPSTIRQINDWLRQIKECNHRINQMKYDELWGEE